MLNRRLFLSILSLIAIGCQTPAPRPLHTQALTRAIIVDREAWHFNWAAFDQDKVVTFGSYQYSIYWDADKVLVVVRRDLRTQEVQALRLGRTLTVNPNDSHRNTVLGISPEDGRLHLSWDHHIDQLNYTKTRKFFLTSPPAEMTVGDFEPPQPLAKDAPQRVTYPRFFNDSLGRLYFMYRSGTSGNGKAVISRYASNSGTWTVVSGKLFGSTGTYESWGNSRSRNAYLHDVLFDGNDRMHVTWVYRETAQTYASNHDLHYAYSDDFGVTWMNNGGLQIADLSRNDPILLTDPGIVVYKIPVYAWLMNQCAMAIDSNNQPHVATFHLPEVHKPKTITHGPEGAVRKKQRFYHYYRIPSGAWKRNGPLEMPDGLSVGRPGLVIDEEDNIVIYWASKKGFLAYVASADDQWNAWRIIPMTGPEFTSNDISKHDRRLLKEKGILSFTADPNGRTKGRGFAILDFNFEYFSTTTPYGDDKK